MSKIFNTLGLINISDVSMPRPNANFYSKRISTPIGTMLAIADSDFLYLLEFETSPFLGRKITSICYELKATIHTGTNEVITKLQEELELYFSGKLKKFSINIKTVGTDFQRKAWSAVSEVPYGKTCSYKEQANNINKPSSFRAIANANSANKIAIIIPCHRIINRTGNIGGYSGGIDKKLWLLEHEKTK